MAEHTRAQVYIVSSCKKWSSSMYQTQGKQFWQNNQLIKNESEIWTKGGK